jgi:CheY-like chemotaxis protein
MDGIETAECIRAREGGNQCSLIAVTGWGQDHDRQLTQAAGFAAHLTKPVNLDQLQSVLSSVLAGV